MRLLNFNIANDQPICLIAGPCVIESEKLVMDIAEKLKTIASDLKLNFIFKASFDKANRTSIKSFRGLGLNKGLEILAKAKHEFKIPILTDVHEDTPLNEVASVVDVLQTPAFLCRQTNFMQNVAKQGLPVNVKKGQFLSPWDMKNVIEKMRLVGNDQLMLCERGFVFGYNNLVVDMRSLDIMKQMGPVIFDATHSVQLPGGQGNCSGGQREFIPVLARSATAVGIAGLFMETHPDPSKALSDGPNAIPLNEIKSLLTLIKTLDSVVKQAKITQHQIDNAQ